MHLSRRAKRDLPAKVLKRYIYQLRRSLAVITAASVLVVEVANFPLILARTQSPKYY